MTVLARTPDDRLVDGAGRPYFLWDEDMTLEAVLHERAYGRSDLKLEPSVVWSGEVLDRDVEAASFRSNHAAV